MVIIVIKSNTITEMMHDTFIITHYLLIIVKFFLALRSLHLALFFTFSLSPSLFLSLFLPLFSSLSLSLYFMLFFSLSFSLSLFFPLSLSLCLY